jgi:NAD(P)-dependent dehydrogenase (short-subunit alcohol dehydrogenase family)
MAGRVENKVALITGGGSGIGRATALLFGREGAKVMVADYDPEGGEHTVKTIKETGGAAVFHAADVSNPQDVDGLMHKVVETYGRLDCAFNNAGIEGQGGETPECSLDNWNRVIAINLTGVFLCMKYEIPLMLKHGGGSIVNTASAAGLAGGPAYVAANERRGLRAGFRSCSH